MIPFFYVGNNKKNGNVLYHANEKTQKYNVGKLFWYKSIANGYKLLTVLFLITIVYRGTDISWP